MASESVGSWAPPPSSPPSGGVATPRFAISPAVVRNTQTTTGLPLVPPLTPDTVPNLQSSPLTPRERGNCFKCNQHGHWASNCPLKRGLPASPSSPAPASGGGQSEFPDFRCSCGEKVFAKQSHTEKNPNRWFYSCRNCSFWKWCDMVISPGSMRGSASPLTPTGNRDCTPKTPESDKKQSNYIPINLEHVFDASAGTSADRRQPAAGSGKCPVMCRCGILCRVLTSRTPQNPNRRFCKCSKQGPESCNFFEWCDEHIKKTDDEKLGTAPVGLENAVGTSSPTSARTPANAGNKIASTVPIGQDSGVMIPLGVDQTHGVSFVSHPICSCGAGKCLISQVTEGENVGRSRYVCPIKKGQGACNFFQWVESPANPEETKNTVVDRHEIPSFQLINDEIPNNQLPQNNLSPNKGAVKPGACYKCGKDGHWAKECRVSH